MDSNNNNNTNNKQQHPEKNLKNMKVALFCIAGILVFYLGANFLKGIDALSKKTYYYAVFDNIGGLQESTAVTVNGYKIGKVNKISLLSTNPVKICAEILVTEDIKLPKDSKFEIVPKDFLGGTLVNVIMGQSHTFAHNGDTLACDLVPSLMADMSGMKGQLQSVLTSVDTIGQAVKSVFNTKNPNNGAQTLKNTLDNLESSSRQLNNIIAANGSDVTRIVNKLNSFSTTLNNATPQLDAILKNLNNITDTIAQANILKLLNDAQHTVTDLNSVVGKIQRGEGSAGKLLNDDSLYNNLNKTSESLDNLLKDVKEHPYKYINISVFGNKNKNKNINK